MNDPLQLTPEEFDSYVAGMEAARQMLLVRGEECSRIGDGIAMSLLYDEAGYIRLQIESLRKAREAAAAQERG